MEQLTLNIINKSKTKIIASSAYNFKIELIETLGKDDLPDILSISKELSEIYGNHVLIDLKNINKYFNSKTLPFIARNNDKIIGFITSTDYGYSVNKGIAYAYLPLKYSKSGTKLKIMYFEKMFDAVVAEEPLYDPKGRKMRI